MDIISILSRKPFAIIGHRGSSAVKENTIEAIKLGIEAGSDIVEVDVRRTKDNKLILLHDKTFKRVWGIDIAPEDVTYKFIRNNVGNVPLLSDVIDFIDGRVGLFIEIKEVETAPNIAKLVLKKPSYNWIAIISFHENALRIVRDTSDNLTIGLIYAEPPGDVLNAKDIGARIVLPHFRLASKKAVRFAHELDMKVVAWTVNTEKRWERLIDNGVDAIATDHPEELFKWRKTLS